MELVAETVLVFGGRQAGRRTGRRRRLVTAVRHRMGRIGTMAGGVSGRLPRTGGLVAGRLRGSVHGVAGGGGRFRRGKTGQVQRESGNAAGLLQELLDQEPDDQHDGHLAEDQRFGGFHADQRHHDRHEHLHLHLHHHHERHQHFVLHHAHFHVRYKRYKRKIEFGLFETQQRLVELHNGLDDL